MEGEADRFGPTAGTELGRDGRWSVEPVERAAYKTRMVVLRPVDAAAFNGTVVVLWNNVSAGYENFTGGDSPEVFENGFAYVAASVQRVGIHGQPDNPQGLRDWDPERYGSLSIPSDDYSFDIYTQIANLVAPDRPRDGLDPMGGLEVRRIVAQGASQSAARLASYLDGVQPLTRRFDAFFLVMYFGGGTPLEVGDEVMTVREAAADASQPRIPEGLHLLRDDLGIPVMVLNTECEADVVLPGPPARLLPLPLLGGGRCVARLAARHGVVVTSHAAGLRVHHSAGRRVHAGHQPGLRRAGRRRGPAPPPDLADRRAPRHRPSPASSSAGSQPEIVRDEHGIARGGIRLPQVEVPLGHNSAIQQSPDIFARLVGYHESFPVEKVRELLRRAERRISPATGRRPAPAEAASVVLPRDVDPLLAEAEAALPL